MLMCISIVSYSMLINGEAKGNIVPSRGLRQEDLISPYLFLLCAEGLSAMLRKEEEHGTFGAYQFAKEHPKSLISSLQTIVLFSGEQMWMREEESLKS